MIIKTSRPISCYYDLWEYNISFYYLILLDLSSKLYIDIVFPIDIIRNLLNIYLKYEIQNIPFSLRCHCDLQLCQLKWLKLVNDKEFIKIHCIR